MLSTTSAEPAWLQLDLQPGDELQLNFTLPTGQSFRWRKVDDGLYSGVIGSRLVQVRQSGSAVQYRVIARGQDAVDADDAAVLSDYFNCSTNLAALCADWSARDPRFNQLYPYFRGARMLRQDPLECLFQFICSSNNHISRIHGMVERLCSSYGTPLLPSSSAAAAADSSTTAGLSFYAFPSLQQLSAATEEELRAAGFGYRAKFITGSVQQLLAKPDGGSHWLHSLRSASYEEAAEQLCTLPGIGPKVAACICLFSLDKHAAIPVDTHVWQLAVRHYTPQLRGRALTPKLHSAVQQALELRFGPYAGWAHNTLFIAELAQHQQLLPPALRSAAAKGSGTAQRKRSKAAAAGSDDVDAAGEGGKRRRAAAAAAAPAAASDDVSEGSEGVVAEPEELGKGKRPTASRLKRQAAAAAAAASSYGSSRGQVAQLTGDLPSVAKGPRRRGGSSSSSSKLGKGGAALQQSADAAGGQAAAAAAAASRRLSITSGSSTQTAAAGLSPHGKQHKSSMSFFFEYNWED